MKSEPLLNIKQLKITTLVAYFSLLFYMPLWLIIINPSVMSPWLSLSLFTLPLLFPLKGLVTGDPYTYAWTNFIIMLFFLHSVTTLFVSASDVIWASIELTLTTVLFLSSIYYAKYRGQELGLSIRRKKDQVKPT
ncbi:MAG: hypothetical protein COB35_03395 [Gammaproteobacteria bacterium]|nr:MAG: hypothetical protein COB35_03395 [Gammaproteobacteria bacterium]